MASFSRRYLVLDPSVVVDSNDSRCPGYRSLFGWYSLSVIGARKSVNKWFNPRAVCTTAWIVDTRYDAPCLRSLVRIFSRTSSSSTSSSFSPELLLLLLILSCLLLKSVSTPLRLCDDRDGVPDVLRAEDAAVVPVAEGDG